MKKSLHRLLSLVVVSTLALTGIALTAPSASAATAPKSFKTITGQRYDSIRVQWAWTKGISSYEIQTATSPSFSSGVRTVNVKGKKSKPKGSVMAVTVSKLQNATKYQLRIRSVVKGKRSAWSNAISAATKVRTPSSITSVTSKPGPGVGEITINWVSAGKYTTRYSVKTGLTSFSSTQTGKQARTFSVSGKARSLTLSADQVAGAGARVGSGNHLFFRVYATNVGTAGSKVKWHPYQKGAMPQAVEPPANGIALRAGSFNVRTARATDDARPWLTRVPDVAQSILSNNLDIVALQELGPGRADGKTGSTTGTIRQNVSLVNELHKVGGARFQLTRITPYVKAGTPSNSQGARILYDTSKFTMLSNCVDSTGTSSYSSSCSITLPLNAGDSESERRRATYALFEERASKKRFYFVSAHLDSRSSSNLTADKAFNDLRGKQSQTINAAVTKLNTANYPVIIGGDFNSWQNDAAGHSSHDVLVAAGYYDTAHATVQVNLKYSTISHFEKVQSASSHGYASRLDMILVKNVQGAARFANITNPIDTARPSDHNLVYADLRL